MKRVGRILLTLAIVLLFVVMARNGAIRRGGVLSYDNPPAAKPATERIPWYREEHKPAEKSSLPEEKAKAGEPTSVQEGFLTRNPLDGSYLYLIDIQMPQGIDDWHVKLGHVPWVQIETSTDLAKMAADTWHFPEFLRGEVGTEALPRARVALEIAGTPQQDVPHRLVRVVEQEVLGDRWLLAWRSMADAIRETRNLDGDAPVLERRSALLAAADHFARALQETREARKGESPARWRIRAEAAFCNEMAGNLRGFGLESALASTPGFDALRRLVEDSASPATFRSGLVSTWGEEALEADALFYDLDTLGDGTQIARRDPTLVRAGDIGEMEADRYDELRAKMRRWDDILDDDAKDVRVKPDDQKRANALGVTIQAAGASDRKRLFLEGGVRILSVASGSAAEAAGLRPGDILWRGQNEGKPVRTVRGYWDLEGLIGEEGAGPQLTLSAFRGDQKVTLVLVVPR